MRERSLLTATILLTFLFLALTALILQADLQPTILDRTLTRKIQQFPEAPVGALLIAVSRLGFAPISWLIYASAVLFMALRRWHTMALFTGIAAVAGITAQIAKVLVARPRPTPDLARITDVLNTYSFPSGHVTSYVAFYGFLFYLAYTLMPRRSAMRLPLLFLFGSLMLLVGPSRIYMGQHWASDALAGYALGFAYLLAVIQAYRYWTTRRRIAGNER